MPEITRFATETRGNGRDAPGMTWTDIDISDERERDWLRSWAQLGEDTKSLLLGPVRFSHSEPVHEGVLLSLKAVRGDKADGFDQPTDFRLLIGKTDAVTVRSGSAAPVDELRRYLRSNSSLKTPVDLLAFMISGMTKRLETVIFDLTMATDALEDQLLDVGTAPPPEALIGLQQRVFRARRQIKTVQQVLSPIATDPAVALASRDRETLARSSNHVNRYIEALDDCRTRLRMLEDQIEAQRAESMTRSSLELTVVATVFLPLTFITGLLGMNVAGIPDEHDPWGFWFVTSLSLLVALLAWLVLRRRMHDKRR